MGLCESVSDSSESGSGSFASRCESRVTITDSATRTIWGPPCESVSDSREFGSFACQCESRVTITELNPSRGQRIWLTSSLRMVLSKEGQVD